MKLSRQDTFKLVGWAGVVVTLLGYVTQLVTTRPKLSWGLIIAGLVLAVAGLAGNFGELRESFSRRSTRLGANSAAVTLAVVAILGFLNFLGYRYHKRFDVTAEKLFSISDQTRKVLGSLKQDVKVIYFSRNESELRDLIEEYRDVSKRVTYERIDLQARPELAQQFGNPPQGSTIVIAGNRRERLTTAPGEQELTNAIMKVTREQAKTVCFTEGHGEKSLAAGGADGYGVVDTALKNDNYATKTVNLLTTGQVPPDCSVLVVAGPKKALVSSEAEAVTKFLEGGGKALVAVDPDTDPELGGLLQSWGIELRNDTVIGDVIIPQLGRAAPVVLDYGEHPATKAIRDIGRVGTVFPLSRSIKTDAAKTDVTVTDLVKTSAGSFGETELKGGSAQLDEGKDTRGPLTLGVAATKKVGEKEARLVVFGDSDFAASPYAGLPSLANRDLFVNAVNWLAEDEDLISIRPKSPTNRSITLEATQQNLFFLLALGLPLAVLGVGAGLWWKRR
jgi:ABC-type uncharacterized transport system involved in gliding motility auxiliary subunit